MTGRPLKARGRGRTDIGARKAADTRVLERSEAVLWTIAPPGAILHNFTRRRFLELDGLGYRIWAFLDGARTVEEVVERCSAGDAGARRSRLALKRRVRATIDTLAAHGFVVGRGHA